VQELLRMERELKEARKVFDQNDDQVGALKEAGKRRVEDDGESVGTAGPGPSKKAKTKGKKSARRVSS
jgi:transcription initiation factor TFIID subunit 13